ncbi:hypothetical protein GCM10012275_33480 [Longimycelium tulufanense]|uniref:Uncharacterized protein n=1 Tax=Longimycelium tulufanense TaxID=907463 RepID=A0A8J3CFW7_9PSEU|nr:hypothetical protein [Longimycelium tulufanense]GGM59692.1 hypothetical protein GCM10012275_33480 [Longimycelium tulufanense]
MRAIRGKSATPDGGVGQAGDGDGFQGTLRTLVEVEMGGHGFRVEEEALRSYAGSVPGIADDLGKIGSTLDTPATLGDDCFSRLGHEVGLAEAFRRAARASRDGVTAAARGLGGLAGAVGDALAGYQRQDQETAAALRRAGR